MQLRPLSCYCIAGQDGGLIRGGCVPGQWFGLVRAILAGASLLGLLTAAPAHAWSPYDLFAPCAGDCATAIYWGDYVETSMVDIFFDPIPPNDWDFRNDSLIATAVSRNAGHWKRLTFEPEVGIGQRYGKQDETELWAALFVRYHGFPWDDYLTTTFALSTGLNWATGISEIEQERARDGEGSRSCISSRRRSPSPCPRAPTSSSCSASTTAPASSAW